MRVRLRWKGRDWDKGLVPFSDEEIERKFIDVWIGT